MRKANDLIKQVDIDKIAAALDMRLSVSFLGQN